MFDTLNLLIGLAVVILVVSFGVTIITQFVVSLLNLRGYALRLKVKTLLVLVDNGITPDDASLIAGLVLRNALIGKVGLPTRKQKAVPETTATPVAVAPAQPPPQPAPSQPAPAQAAPAPAQPAVAAPATATQAAVQPQSPATPTNPGGADSGLPWQFGFRPASVVLREELTRLLLAFGKTPSEYPDTWYWFFHKPLDTKRLQQKMAQSLARNGIDDAAQVLQDFRTKVLELERDQPNLSNAERASQAMLSTTTSAFIGKLYGWFDQTVDRAGDLFTGWTQLVAVAIAAALAFGLQIDTIALINRLSTDTTVRTQLVNWAVTHVTPANGTSTAGGQGAGGNSTNSAEASLPPQVETAAIRALADDYLIALPQRGKWWDRWSGPIDCPPSPTNPPNCKLPQVSIPGVLLSTILLSLGGPFWYAVLQNLLKLRSTVASKDDAQRQDRQTNTTPKPSGGGGSAPAKTS